MADRPHLPHSFVHSVVAAALLLGLVGHADRAKAAEFRRGIGVSHAMAWARVEPGSTGTFAFPPFSDPDNRLRGVALATLRRTGFDFIRLAVDPGPFLQTKGARRDTLDDILLDRVKRIAAAGLAVIVDFHPSDLQRDYTAKALTGGVDTPVFQAYLRLLERTAALLASLNSDSVALELMNEPPAPASLWQPMLEAAYAAARRGAPHLPLVLEGGNEASATALMAMRTAAFTGDRAVLFSFHYYDPYQFTHQGAPWNAARYLADVPYPAIARPLADSLQATAAAIGAADLPREQTMAAYRDALARLEAYRNSRFGAEIIAQSFTEIADWARAHGVAPAQVLLGEFGARKTALQSAGPGAAERAQWFHDVRAAAEDRGFGWAVWAYRGGGGFALARSDTADDIDPAVAQALGLNLGVQRKAADAP